MASGCSLRACIVVPLLCTFASWFCSALACRFAFWFAKVTPFFSADLFVCCPVQECSGVIAPCFVHCFAVSSAVMPPRPMHNSLESFVSPVSSAPASTTSVTSIAVPTSVLTSVIQAIQSPISAIVQQSLSAVISVHSVSQGLPVIATQGSSLATCAAHLDACGFHQPWSPLVPTEVLPSTSSSSTPPVPVPTPTNVVAGMLSSLIVLSFFPAFSSAPLSFIAPCSSAVNSHPTTINSALASHPFVSLMAFPSLTALPLQQLFMVGPCYSPVPFKVVSQITVGKFESGRFVSRKYYRARARATTLVQWPVSVVAHAEKRKRPIMDITSWIEAFSIFCISLCSSFPHRWRDLKNSKLLSNDPGKNCTIFYCSDAISFPHIETVVFLGQEFLN